MIYRAQKIVLKFLPPKRMIDNGWEKGQDEFGKGTDITGRQVWFYGRCNGLNTSKGYVPLTVHRLLKAPAGARQVRESRSNKKALL